MTLHDLELVRAGVVEDNFDTSCVLWRPGARDLMLLADQLASGALPPWAANVPPHGEDHWRDDNHAWIITYLSGRFVPDLGPAPRAIAAQLAVRNHSALLLLLEAYLSRISYGGLHPEQSFEQAGCDGATGVMDIWPAGVCAKQISATAHDLAFVLHHAGLPDASGKVWTLDETNIAFADILVCEGHDAAAIAEFHALGTVAAAWWA